MPLQTISSPQSWNDVLKNSYKYDFYHTYSYHRNSEELGEGTPIMLHYFDGDYSISLPLLVREIEGTTYKDLTSIYGYGGLLMSHSELPESVISAFQKALISWAAENNIVSIFSRLHPLLNQQSVLKGLGEVINSGTTVSIDLRQDVEEQRKGFNRDTRYNINKLRRQPLTVWLDKELECLDDFVEIYHENMRRVDAKNYYMFERDYFYKLLTAEDFKCELYFVKQDNVNVCGGLFTFNQGIVQYHLSGTRNDYLKLGPMRLLLDEVRLKATKEGYEQMHLGGGLGGSNADPLFKFKAGFSKQLFNFYLWKFIVNEEAYQNLVRSKGIIENTGFFPLYRAK